MIVNTFYMRTIEMYSKQVALVENDRSLASVYELKANCPLNVLDNFHCITGLPSDIAHDLFEGVVSYVLTNVIKSFVPDGFFSPEDLNKSILLFKFSEIDKSNRPSKAGQVFSKLKISQSAAQMWCFIRFLPLLVGNTIPQKLQKVGMYSSSQRYAVLCVFTSPKQRTHFDYVRYYRRIS